VLARDQGLEVNRRDLEYGDVLDGRFLVLELIKEGGTSRVYKATDIEAGELVALKIPNDHYARDTEFLERFAREEEIGLGVGHRYLVRMKPVSQKTRPYLVMEYLKGETLEAHLASGQTLSVGETLRIARMTLDGLGELHRQGIVHRDVSPKNIMLCEDGTIRLIDFGIAEGKACGKLGSQPEDSTWGTPAYMAPEQVEGTDCDGRTDIYGLGATLYELLTGEVPFKGEDSEAIMNLRLTESPRPPRLLRPDIPPGLESIVLRALSRHRKDRFQSAREMRTAITSLAIDLVEGRHRTPARSGLRGMLRRFPGWARSVFQASAWVAGVLSVWLST
jgi:serine/threonine-protein kinase